MKTITNTELTKNNINQEVTLFGWVSRKRNLGGMLFIDLRDRNGIIQLVIKPDNEIYQIIEKIKTESVIEVTGIVKKRENINDKLTTGNIEILVNKLNILNNSKDLPFDINDSTKSLEDTRLKYRYLDLRRNELYNNFKIRHQITMATRNYLNDNGFIEVETPILCKSTPEGARDYLVPSRISKGKFYALPQSPQLFKQLLMVSGFERYFQIAKCFRDEDLRADRQPEFTQIDIEMSFIDEKDILETAENLVAKILKDVKNIDIKLPLKRMTYQNAINIYGTDKPDLRFELPIIDLNQIFKNTSISFLKNKTINCLLVKNSSEKFSRKDIDKLTEYVKPFGASSIVSLKFNNNELSGSLANNINDEEKNNLINTLKLENNDIIFIIADNYNIVKKSLGALRLKLGKNLDLINKETYELLWVVDFPLFEYDEKNKLLTAVHHPFTSPKELDVNFIKTNPEKLLSKAYDLVINGYEAGGGSIRIHDNEIQTAIFDVIGLSKNEIDIKFGWFVEALKYGTPPHGGIALGLDRLTMLLCETDNIRDVIAFPKTANANCLMSESPSTVDLIQLDELGIKRK